MVSFYQIENIDSLFSMFNKCAGSIFITGSDGSKINIKNNLLIKELLENACQKHGIETLNITVENSQDIPLIANYLIGYNRQTKTTKN